MLFAAGLLTSQGFFNPWILVPLVTIAAILGDSVGYWFGAKVGVRLFLRPNSFWFRHKHLEHAKHFYDQYGIRTIVLARFVPVVRTFAPIVAGVVKMPYRTFITYNVIGALLWASGVTLAGYYLGRIPFVQHYFTPILVGIIVLSCVPIASDDFRPHVPNEDIALSFVLNRIHIVI